MGVGEMSVEAAVASAKEICKPKDADKILTENKELAKNGVKEDCKVNGKSEAAKADEKNDSKEEKNKGEEMEEDSKVNKKGEALGTGEDNDAEKEKNKEEEMEVDRKVNDKGENLTTGEENDAEEQKSKEEEMEVDSKENGKGEALSTGEENVSVEQKIEDSKENRTSEGLRNDEENGSNEQNAKEEEEPTEAVGSLKRDEEHDMVEDNEEHDMVEDTEKIEAETDESKHEEEKTEESKDEQGKKNRRRGKSVMEKEENKNKVDEKNAKEPIIPAIFYTDRPVRERKTVERLVSIIEKESTKEFCIEKGRGTALKDIPNVAYKLSRKKFEETFKMLHVILFGRRGKAVNVKNNLSRFSGFAWHENEEKQKLKIKEKFDKYVKEKLVEICDVLDIHVSKATTRKEDIVTKLLDFLVAPHATTDILLAEKEQPIKGTKRKRENAKTEYNFGSPTAKRSARKQRKAHDIPKEEKSTHETEDESVEDDEENDNSVPAGSEEEVSEHSESEDKADESEEETRRHKNGSTKSPAKIKSSKKPSANKIASPKATTVVSSPEKPSNKSSSKHSMLVTSDASPIVFSRKKKNVEAAKTKSSTMSKSATTAKASNEKTGKKVGRGGKNKSREDFGPTDDEVRKVIYEILKEADLNKATFTDILKQLAQHFGMDFAPNKSSVKLLIQEELTKLADEAEELGKDEDETKGEKKEVQEPVGQAVEA